ncbi:hypothetical protein [Massilia genomosp. 1]|uniref:Bulb-type lectin domain-containing protein n=1 Tax=Massilia genomosp. 1 TaxID=2609280 RepID=A0ABX0MWU1_9BURK|nr:hypothetical protein [Massilia genomosp. 1]NHZ66477.1 hypothetical protein [Massilia genomosp. 1]
MLCNKKNLLGVCLSGIATLGVAASTLTPNEFLVRGQYLQSPQGAYTLNMQSDGSLVMYRNDGLVRYRMSKNGEFAVMQGDGNFVEYSKFAVPLWNTGTNGNPGAWLSVQDDGNLVVYSRVNTPLWNIGVDNGENDPHERGDVVGRELDTHSVPLFFIGHIGLWNGEQVIEASEGGENAIKLVNLNNFKSIARYWGTARPRIPDGVIEPTCYDTFCPSNGERHISLLARVAIARFTEQQRLLGASYNLLPDYRVAEYADKYHDPKRGLYRCDTFVSVSLRHGTKYVEPWTRAQSLWSDRVDTLFKPPVLPTTMFDKLKSFN